MSSWIESLLVLQERDTRLQTVEKELALIPKEELAWDGRLQGAQTAFENKKKTVQGLEAERKKVELEVGSKKQQIVKYKSQQLETRKNEEFQALGNEIKHAEETIQSLDDQQLEFMEKIEVAQKQLLQDEAVFKKATTDHQQGKKNLADKKIALEKARTEALALKSEAESKVEEILLRKYQRILASKKDFAIVPLRAGVCGGCHMKVTSQTLVAVRSAKEPISCENCSRLLYLVE